MNAKCCLGYTESRLYFTKLLLEIICMEVYAHVRLHQIAEFVKESSEENG